VIADTLKANDTDIDNPNAELSVTAVGNPVNGTVTLEGGNISFTPEANFAGTGGFDYTLSDGALTDAGHVAVTVTPVNDAPVAADDAYATEYGTQLAVVAPGVLGNDSDVEGDPLAAVLVTGPSHGALVLDPDGSFTYTPDPAYSGADSFTYTANDGELDSNTATVSITVRQPDLIFGDGFEDGTLAAWSRVYADGGDLSVMPGAALQGGLGLQVGIDDNTPLYLVDTRPSAESRYRVRFYFDPNSIAMNNNDGHNLLRAVQGTSGTVFWMLFLKQGGSYLVRPTVLDDGLGYRNLAYQVLSDGPHYIELDWQAGAGDGYLSLWIDGQLKQTLSGMSNASQSVDEVWFGPYAGIDSGTRGAYYLDSFESRRVNPIGP
jgi:hypothetical protein